MRSPCVVFAALLFMSTAGCTTEGRARSTTWFTSLPSFRGPSGPDVVQLEWALIERPVGDRYLNEGLWALANEQVVPLERKNVLEDNGLRIAQVGGLLPAEFQELLQSERTNPNARRRQVRAGQAAVLLIGPVRAECDCAPPSVVAGRRGVHLAAMFNAQMGIAVTPSLVSGNRVRLSLTPQVQQGEAKVAIKPAEDGSGWTSGQQAAEKYSELSWDVTLAPDEYLLVGCRFVSQHTFGKECFVRIDEPRPVQRLLVIRAARQVPEEAGTEIAEENLPPRTAAAVAQGSGATLR
jgi:hypothetical protein